MNLRKIGLSALLAPLALISTTAVQAGGPIAQCDLDQPLVWGAGGLNIPYNPDQGGLGLLDNATATVLVDDAFAVWEAVPTSTATYTNAGQLPVDVDITNFLPYLDAPAPDGLSAIVYDETGEIFDLLFGPGSGILGFAGPEWGFLAPVCEITEGLSFLNGPAFDASGPVAAFDVMVHEFGHYSGLGHTVVNGQIFIGAGDTAGPTPLIPSYGFPDPVGETIATMYPFYFGPTVGTGTLHKDDAATLSELYPDASFAATTASISGEILASNGSTPITGVNVIARNEADPFLDAVSAISGDVNLDGDYTISGLTPGAQYRVYVDEILAGGFSTDPAVPFPGQEEYYNGANESNNLTSPDPFDEFELVTAGASGVDVIFNAPAPGDPLAVGDDGNVEISMPFTFGFCGNFYDSVFIHANGFLTFGAPDDSFFNFIPDVGAFLAGPPRITGLWQDFNPTQGGTVFYDVNSKYFSAHWEDVPEWFATGANSFEVRLYRGGADAAGGNEFRIYMDDIEVTSGIAGYSCGGAVTSGFEEAVDLSTQKSNIKTKDMAATYEQFFGDFDLDGDSLRFRKTNLLVDAFESNDSPDNAACVSLPFDTKAGTSFSDINPGGSDIDWYAFRGEAGSTLVAEVVNGVPGFDSVVGLFYMDYAGKAGKNDESDPDQSCNRRLRQVFFVDGDDDGGAGFLSKLVTELPLDGDYAVAVTTFPDYGFTGAGFGEGRYVLDLYTVEGTPLTLGDDTSVEVALPFDFPFQGGSYSSVFVNGNGYMTFGADAPFQFSENTGDFLSGPPRAAGLWVDLSPNQGGTVIAQSDADSFSVTFQGVPQFLAGDSNNFTMTLHSDGSVSYDYGAVNALDGIVGVTEGGGAADPGASDVSAGSPFSVFGTTYEQFQIGNDFDLSGSSVDFE